MKTTVPAALAVLQHEDFINEKFSTLWLESTVTLPESEPTEDHDDEELTFLARNEVEVAGRLYTVPFFNETVPGLASGIPTVPAAPAETAGNGQRPRPTGTRRGSKKASDGTVKTPMQGTIVKINAVEGQQVEAGEVLFVLEAMKMENPIPAPVAGTVGKILATVGESLAAGTLLTAMTVLTPAEANHETVPVTPVRPRAQKRLDQQGPGLRGGRHHHRPRRRRAAGSKDLARRNTHEILDELAESR